MPLKLLSGYGTASKRLGDVVDENPYTLYSRRNSPVFDIISKLLQVGELPLVCSLLPFFTENFFILGILCLFRVWLILPNFPWILLPSFNSHKGLSTRHSNLFLEPTRISFRLYEAFFAMNSMSDTPVSEREIAI